MFLRDFGVSETQFIACDHRVQKGESIAMLSAANNDLPTLLIGDTGQRDAEICAVAIPRHPGRIRPVILRAAESGRNSQARTGELKNSGVPMLVGPDLSAHMPRLAKLLGLEPRPRGREMSP